MACSRDLVSWLAIFGMLGLYSLINLCVMERAAFQEICWPLDEFSAGWTGQSGFRGPHSELHASQNGKWLKPYESGCKSVVRRTRRIVATDVHLKG
ncbi:hypothetical protein FA13DRAFT_862881 [Coprinellus micaceus]|uniref:Uncharacterized protein n=1 Tax=Coprinellus micaceus TaxID=71717 RepID=A0A4Y7S1F9_COPMI|nr:hypothetical protein FA13DRAFT_862881 [Coprinellus micaceus]